MVDSMLSKRLVYVMGVYQSLLTMYILGYNIHYAKMFHFLKLCIYLPYRAIEFKRKNMHYYMVEFCYYVSVLIVAYLFVDLFTDYSSDYLFITIFALASGPLGLSVFINNDRLYFHSPSHLTSVLIHLSPVMLVWRIRWDNEFMETHPPSFSVSGLYDTLSILYTFIAPLYAIWFVGYYIFMSINHNRIIEEDLDTMLKYIQAKPGHKIKSLFTKEHSYQNQIIYMIIHLLSSILGITLSALLYNSYYLNSFVMISVTLAATWNSSYKYIKLLDDYEKKKE